MNRNQFINVILQCPFFVLMFHHFAVSMRVVCLERSLKEQFAYFARSFNLPVSVSVSICTQNRGLTLF